MIPSAIANYAAQGIAFLTGKYGSLPGITGFIKARMTSTQELEGVFQDILNLRQLVNATGAQVDLNGALVGQPRNGMSDSDYKAAISLRVAVDNAVGKMGDWAGFGTILLRSAAGPAIFFEGLVANFAFGVFDLALSPVVVASVLAAAVPNGVRAAFVFSTWTPGNDIIWADATGANGQGVWGKSDASTGGLWLAALELS